MRARETEGDRFIHSRWTRPSRPGRTQGVLAEEFFSAANKLNAVIVGKAINDSALLLTSQTP